MNDTVPPKAGGAGVKRFTAFLMNWQRWIVCAHVRADGRRFQTATADANALVDRSTITSCIDRHPSCTVMAAAKEVMGMTAERMCMKDRAADTPSKNRAPVAC